MADLGSALASVLQVPGLQELLNQSISENRQVAPTRTAIQQQALNMLPNSAFGGGARPNLSAIPQANFSTPAPSGGVSLTTVLPILAAALAGGGALAKALGAPGASNLARIVNGLRGLNTGPGPWASGDNPGNALDPNPPASLDPNYVPPGTQPSGSQFNFGVGGGGSGNGMNLDQFSFYNPSIIQNPSNPNAAAFGGAPIGGPDQMSQAGGQGIPKAF